MSETYITIYVEGDAGWRLALGESDKGLLNLKYEEWDETKRKWDALDGEISAPVEDFVALSRAVLRHYDAKKP